jgi:hypothetical protein
MATFTDLLRAFGQADHASRAVADMEQAHMSGPQDTLALMLAEARDAHHRAAEACQEMIDGLDL